MVEALPVSLPTPSEQEKGQVYLMPISWDELDTVAPDGIKMKDALQRISRNDPWKGILQNDQLLKSY